MSQQSSLSRARKRLFDAVRHGTARSSPGGSGPRSAAADDSGVAPCRLSAATLAYATASRLHQSLRRPRVPRFFHLPQRGLTRCVCHGRPRHPGARALVRADCARLWGAINARRSTSGSPGVGGHAVSRADVADWRYVAPRHRAGTIYWTPARRSAPGDPRDPRAAAARRLDPRVPQGHFAATTCGLQAGASSQRASLDVEIVPVAWLLPGSGVGERGSGRTFARHTRLRPRAIAIAAPGPMSRGARDCRACMLGRPRCSSRTLARMLRAL